MSSITGKNKKKAAIDGVGLFRDILAKAAGVYILVMFILFPLFASDMYYDILDDKFYVFFYATAALFAAFFVITLIGFMSGALRGEGGKRFFRPFIELNLTDKLFLGFFVCALISTLSSEWLYESFWGNMGRMQGLFFLIICLVSYFLVTRFYRFNPVHLYIFLLVGAFVCFWGFTDFLGVDLFGWRGDADDYEGMLIFSSSYGNVNTVTAVFAVYAGAASVMAVRHKMPIPFYLCALICFMGLITGISDNAVLAVAAIFGFLPFWCFDRKSGVTRYLFLCAFFFLSLALSGVIGAAWTKTPVLPDTMSGAFLMVARDYSGICFGIAAGFAVLGLIFYGVTRKNPEAPARVMRKVWYGIFFLVLLAVILIFRDANSGNHAEFWAPYASVMIFNDRWGTNRGYAWRSAFEFFKDFPFLKKLFGTGPETFAIFMAQYNYYDMIEFMDAVFDSPHSEPIQMFFTTGILGGLCYYSAMVTGILKGLKTNPYAAAFAFAMIAYLFASIINISVPISTPYLIIGLEMVLAIKQADEKTV